MGINRFEDHEDFDYEDEFTEEHHYMVDPREMIVSSDFIKFRQEELAVVGQKVNSAVLQQAIGLVQKSFFWRFRSISSKLQLLTQTYYALADLVKD